MQHLTSPIQSKTQFRLCHYNLRSKARKANTEVVKVIVRKSVEESFHASLVPRMLNRCPVVIRPQFELTRATASSNATAAGFSSCPVPLPLRHDTNSLP